MRVINVVSFDNGSLNEIESFGVFEEQLVDDVVEVAEKDFIEKCKAVGLVINEETEDEQLEELLDNGYYDSPDGFHSVYISWSDI